LSKLDKHTPFTVTVNGTCSEYIQVIGFEQLTLKGMPGATLTQPATGVGNLFTSLLLIESSQSVTVQGFSIQADTTTVPAVGIGHGSSDIRLRSLNIQGGTFGVLIFENSQVSIAQVKAQDPGYSPLGVYDASDVHVEHCQFLNSTGAVWHVGVDVGTSHITIYATTIRNMQVGINAHGGAVIDVEAFDTYYPLGSSNDVLIENSKGTNYYGVSVDGGGSLNVQNARLVINQPGQPSNGTFTAGVFISDGATLSAFNGNLLITGSQSHGILVMNDSHATLAGATVTGSSHGGLVAANLSSIMMNSGLLANISGNSVDLFCDSNSLISGSVNIAGTPTAQCANLLGSGSVPLP
jgi:Right handed beta helix region